MSGMRRTCSTWPPPPPERASSTSGPAAAHREWSWRSSDPDLQVTLLESDVRKGGFLVHVAGLLGLTSVTVETIRAEEAGHRHGMREAFDLATSRAAAPPAALCELALPLLRVGGSLCALVTDAPAALESCAAAASACGGGPPDAPAPGLLRVGKIAPTSPEYPRRAGVPSRRPLS